MNRRFISLLAAALTAVIAQAVGIDDIRNMVESGDYDAAFDAAAPLVRKSPRDAALNYWYGTAAYRLGYTSEARKALATAAERGYTDAYADLVDLALTDYDVAAAEKYMDNWETALTKARKTAPALYDELEARLLLMSNQLDRVEDIAVIARYDVDRDAFMSAIEHISESGNSRGMTFLQNGIPLFINNQAHEIFWTEPDSDGVNRLFTAGVLDDGTREDAIELTSYIGDGDIMAPFMLEDGETLYFAAARDSDGLGGYDIYMTRRDGEGGFYEPSNIGMPYNSPGDDLLFVIDEPNNIGWWATDRFAGPDTVSLLVFVPNPSRVNIPNDHTDLVARAKVTDLASTLPKGFDLAAAKARIPEQEFNVKSGTGNNASFALSLGDGRVITAASQFRNRQAASAMSEVLRTRRMLNDNLQRLDSMRKSYAEGNKSLREDIRSLEGEVERQHAELKNLTNRVIKLETNRR